MRQEEPKGLAESFFEIIDKGMQELGEKINEKVGERYNDRKYEDIFGQERREEPESPDHCISKLTWENITNFYFEANKRIPEINSCIILLEDISRMNVQAQYRIEQFFKNTKGELVCTGKKGEQAYGRVIFAKRIDEKLKQQLADKPEVYFEI